MCKQSGLLALTGDRVGGYLECALGSTLKEVDVDRRHGCGHAASRIPDNVEGVPNSDSLQVGRNTDGIEARGWVSCENRGDGQDGGGKE